MVDDGALNTGKDENKWMGFRGWMRLRNPATLSGMIKVTDSSVGDGGRCS